MSRNIFFQTALFIGFSIVADRLCKSNDLKIYLAPAPKKITFVEFHFINPNSMGYSRRTFLKNSALAMAATSFLPGEASSFFKKEVTGLQLYSVRDDMKADPSGTLKKLAEMGYKYVEHAGYVDHKFYGSPA